MALPIVFWHWWALGVVLLIIELLAPGMFFIWMAEAAFIVGSILWVFPGLIPEYQLLAFSVLSVLSIGVFRRYLKRNPITTDRPLLNRRADQYVGRVFTLDEAIVNGRGKIKVDDSTWRVQGEDCEAGARVRVTAAEGVVLKVERAA